MKVLVLTTTFPRWRGDTTPTFVYDLSQQLRREGLEVIILAPHHEGAQFREEMEGLKVYRFPYFYPTKYQRLCYEGGVLANLKNSWIARIQIPFLVLFELIHVLRALRRERFDAVHSHWIIPNGLVAAIIKRFWTITHLSTAHAADVLVLDRSILGRMISNFVVSGSDSMTADGSHVRDRFLDTISPGLRSLAEKRLLVQPMGVDTQAFNTVGHPTVHEAHSRDEFTVLFVGRFAEKKGIEYLLEAVKIVTSESPETRLLLAGSGPREENLREEVKRLKIEPYVRFMGWVGREQLPGLYASSDVVVVPSIVTASGDTEGMPTTIVEALAAGRPVVASDVGGIKDVIQEGFNGILVKEKDPEAIAETLQRLIRDPGLRERLSQNARTSSKEYDWSIIGKRYAKLILGNKWRP